MERCTDKIEAEFYTMWITNTITIGLFHKFTQINFIFLINSGECSPSYQYLSFLQRRSRSTKIVIICLWLTVIDFLLLIY